MFQFNNKKQSLWRVNTIDLDLMYIYIHKAGATLWFSGGNESLPMTPKNKKFMLYIYFNFFTKY